MNKSDNVSSISLRYESSIWDTLLDLLECPVCKEYMVHPIRQCIEGHSMCVNCFDCLNRCPVCRAPRAPWNSLVSQILPEFFYIPCRYRDMGCTFRRKGYRIKYHETFCQYSQRECPLKRTIGCEWDGCFKDVLPHCLQEHVDETLSKGHQITCRNFADIKTSQNTILFVVVYVNKHLFRLAIKYSKSKDQIRWSCSLYGYSRHAKRYLYKLIVLSPNSEPSLEWTQVCCPFYDDDRIFKEKYKAVKTSFSELLERCNDNGELCLYITITDRDITDEGFNENCVTR